MNATQLKALREADAFLDDLSISMAKAKKAADEAAARGEPPAPPTQYVPTGPKSSGRRNRIPMGGQLVEPGRPKPKVKPAEDAKPAEDVEMTESSSPEKQPKEAQTAAAVKDDNLSPWAKFLLDKAAERDALNPRPKAKRKTAMEMWDEVDARREAEEAAAREKSGETEAN
ncbi:hypothetical protein CDD80_1428 [Ophiocordyceps camponoti-rufipedis]|uniref:Uncharacterized protein n=1 Tax=Ophiocordyceps camponoti-rufipedis TaxID=2004952 RepID=A0A2C5Z6C1_9HYPO|nr:hypothetical protein CDD80_1428 [Ophiocordyceps camponoti-rufipedis]